MWPDSEQRAKEVREYAGVFRREGYRDTTTRLEYLAVRLAVKSPDSELRNDVEKTLASFRSEFSSGGPSYAEQFKFIEPLVNFHFSRPPSVQAKFQSLFDNLARNAQNLKPIDEAFKNFSGSTRFYGKCFLYLINAEGMFDEAITLLWGLARDRAKRPVSVEDLHRTRIDIVKGELLKEAPSVLLEGLRRHVRNAIAHCRFHYDEKTRTMNFRDKDADTGEESPESFSMKEFDELYWKLDNVWHVISHLIFMERVKALVMTANVPQAGTLSPIGHQE